MKQKPRRTSQVSGLAGELGFGAFASKVVAEFLSAYFVFVFAVRVATPDRFSRVDCGLSRRAWDGCIPGIPARQPRCERKVSRVQANSLAHRSIASSPVHQRLNLVGLDGNVGHEIALARFGDEEGVLQPHAEAFLREIERRFAGNEPKLSDPASEGARLQPRRDGRIRCAWLTGC